MKKSVRPAASKVSGDRGKAEAAAAAAAGTGKPAAKTGTTAPLSKVSSEQLVHIPLLLSM